jgi:hypothetical protein
MGGPPHHQAGHHSVLHDLRPRLVHIDFMSSRHLEGRGSGQLLGGTWILHI